MDCPRSLTRAVPKLNLSQLKPEEQHPGEVKFITHSTETLSPTRGEAIYLQADHCHCYSAIILDGNSISPDMTQPLSSWSRI